MSFSRAAACSAIHEPSPWAATTEPVAVDVVAPFEVSDHTSGHHRRRRRARPTPPGHRSGRYRACRSAVPDSPLRRAPPPARRRSGLRPDSRRGRPVPMPGTSSTAGQPRGGCSRPVGVVTTRRKVEAARRHAHIRLARAAARRQARGYHDRQARRHRDRAATGDIPQNVNFAIGAGVARAFLTRRTFPTRRRLRSRHGWRPTSRRRREDSPCRLNVGEPMSTAPSSRTNDGRRPPLGTGPALRLAAKFHEWR